MTTILDRGRAEALFCCDLSVSVPLTKMQATVAIRAAVRTKGGVRGCACTVAQEYGDHPDTAAARMRWATEAVNALFGKPASAEIVWSHLAVPA